MIAGVAGRRDAYASARVLVRPNAGIDVRALGGDEAAAHDLGIAGDVAVALQAIAATAVAQENPAQRATGDPCAQTKQ